MILLRFSFLLISLALATGCSRVPRSLRDVVGALPKPTAEIKNVAFRDLSTEAVDLQFNVEVKNPYSFSLPLTDISYDLAVGDSGRSLLTGAAPLEGSVPAKGTKMVALPVSVTFADLQAALTSIKPGTVIPYRADFAMKLQQPGEAGAAAQPLEIPFRKEGKLPVPAAPEIEVQGLEWENLSLTSAKGVLKMRVKNPNEFSAILNKLDYRLEIAGLNTAKGAIKSKSKIGAGKAEELEIPFSMNLASLGLAAMNAMRGGETSYALKGDMDVGTEFGSFTSKLDRSGKAQSIIATK